MDVKTVYRTLKSRGKDDWVEAAGVVPQTVMTRRPRSNISTFAIGRVTGGEENWEDHMLKSGSRWHKYFFGDELETNREVAYTGLDAPRTLAKWKNFKVTHAITDIWKGAKEDYAKVKAEKGSLRAGLLVGQAAVTAAVTIPYLAGGLEATVGLASSSVMQHGGTVIESALAGGGASTVAELSLTILMAGCLKYFKQAAAAFQRQKYETQEFSALSNTGLMLATGSPGVMLRSAVHTPEESYAWKGLRTAALLFPINATLSGTVVGGGLSFAPEWVVNEAVNPLYWFSAFIGYKGLKAAAASLREHHANRAAQRDAQLRTPPLPKLVQKPS